VKAEQRKACIAATVESIKWKIINKAHTDSGGPTNNFQDYNSAQNGPRYMLKIELPHGFPVIKNTTGIALDPQLTPHNIFKEHFPEILQTLQSLFPDTTFTLDPLKTYLLVDWTPV
jgi:hypothetical protein